MIEPPVRLALFAKAPIPGEVKTRLAATLGDDAALQVHRELVRHALQQLCGSDKYLLELWCSEDHPEARGWAEQFQTPLRIQQGDDLGERMENCLRRMCADGALGLIVGCDCPSIDEDYVSAAIAALKSADLVFGPAEDGGYGLIGWAAPEPPPVFSGIAWSSAAVLAETLERAGAAGLKVKTLPMIWDVDSADDWQRYRSSRYA